jgi:O-antigen/teichoic acid export membrane protein
MLVFSGWNIFGTLGNLISTQGINILLNLFFGPIANAAYAICMQFYNAIIQIINSFQNAVTPQITKLYASNQLEELSNLIYENCKFAFILLWLISLPLLIELEYILSIWLIKIPEYTYIFTLLMIIYGLLYSLLRPLVMAIHATAKLKYVQLTAGSLLIMTLPISYFLLKNGYPVYSPFIVSLIIWCFHISIELIFLKKYINISIKKFLLKVILPIVYISLISFTTLYYSFFNMENNLTKFFMVIISSTVIIIILSYFIALDKEKRSKIMTLIPVKFKGQI